ncbi:MAG: ATP-binding cassette domain-containing protein, partial [Lysobacteraceae bacterium]
MSAASLDSRVSAIRTVALVGPAGAGKTLLLDALLAHAGVIPQAGSIERGSTVSDHDPLERRLGHSLQSSLAHFTHGGVRIHAIDTPGAPDFVGQALPALEAADTAIVVINAQNGIELMAQRMLAAARERWLTRLIVVNRIDCPDVDLPGLLAQIREVFGKECLPLNLPANGAQRVADCFFAASGEADFSSVAEAHRALVEQVVEVDDDEPREPPLARRGQHALRHQLDAVLRVDDNDGRV